MIPLTAKATATILVIENNDLVLEMTKEVLEALGYSSLGAKTGREAIDIAKTFGDNIDLAILDVSLPDIGGEEVYPLLMEACPDLKVIVCSVYPRDDIPREILDAGADDYIQKPFFLDELSEKLTKALQRI